MAVEDGLLKQLDNSIDQLFTSWNIYTTVIAIGLVTILLYPIFFTSEPDVHPFLLARQSAASHVRQPGESAIYRSLEVPHGYPLRSGLNVKDENAPKWSSGRDGDLRDVWKQALKGATGTDGKSTGERGRIMSVLGKEEIIEHNLTDVTKEINIVGEYLKKQGCKRVAIHLPNSIELLTAFFGMSILFL